METFRNRETRRVLSGRQGQLGFGLGFGPAERRFFRAEPMQEERTGAAFSDEPRVKYIASLLADGGEVNESILRTARDLARIMPGGTRRAGKEGLLELEIDVMRQAADRDGAKMAAEKLGVNVNTVYRMLRLGEGGVGAPEAASKPLSDDKHLGFFEKRTQRRVSELKAKVGGILEKLGTKIDRTEEPAVIGGLSMLRMEKLHVALAAAVLISERDGKKSIGAEEACKGIELAKTVTKGSRGEGEELKREIFALALKKFGGNITKAARWMGVSPPMIAKYCGEKKPGKEHGETEAPSNGGSQKGLAELEGILPGFAKEVGAKIDLGKDGKAFIREKGIRRRELRNALYVALLAAENKHMATIGMFEVAAGKRWVECTRTGADVGELGGFKKRIAKMAAEREGDNALAAKRLGISDETLCKYLKMRDTATVVVQERKTTTDPGPLAGLRARIERQIAKFADGRECGCDEEVIGIIKNECGISDEQLGRVLYIGYLLSRETGRHEICRDGVRCGIKVEKAWGGGVMDDLTREIEKRVFQLALRFEGSKEVAAIKLGLNGGGFEEQKAMLYGLSRW